MINGNLKTTYATAERVLDNPYKQAFVYGSLVLIALFTLFANDYAILVASQMGILLVAVVGINILTGYTGQISLGHGAFMAVGAYSVAILTNLLSGIVPDPVVVFVVLPISVAISALIGIVVGLPSLRVKGMYLAIATLAASFIIIFLIELDALRGLTGGVAGINTPELNLLGWVFDTQQEKFAFIAVVGVLALLAAQNLMRTRVGRAFIAIRDRDYSAEIMGISLLKYKLMSFALSAAFAGLSGALFAYFYARILPEQFELHQSILIVSALIVGGMGRTMGPVYGVILIVLIPEVIKIVSSTVTGGGADTARYIAPIQEIVFGVVLIIFLLKEPLGIDHIIGRGLRALNRWPFARG